MLHKRGDDGLSPLYGLEDDTSIPYQYIVMFQPNYTLQEHCEFIGIDLLNSSEFVSLGVDAYGTKLDDITLHSHVRLDPGVLFVETDRTAQLIEPIDSYENGTIVEDERQKREYRLAIEKHAPYGLQMLGASGKLSTPVSDDGQYDYVYGAGQGVNVYVFDTG